MPRRCDSTLANRRLAPSLSSCATLSRSFTGDTGTTRVPSDCFSGPYNETCNLAPETALIGDVLRYEAFLPQDPSVLSTVTVTSCVGAANLYLCQPFSTAGGGTKCK